MIPAVIAAAALALQGGDRGQIAVIVADSTIMQSGDPFPMNGRSLLFAPGGGYRVTTGPLIVEPDKGTFSKPGPLDPVAIDLPFDFPFFGKTYRTAYVYYFGVVTFERMAEPEDRTYVEAMQRQPPLIAALWHSAQPYDTGSGMFVNRSLRDRVVITWNRLLAAQEPGITVTYQLTLFRGGGVRIAYIDMQQAEGLVGLGLGITDDRAEEVRLLDTRNRVFTRSFTEWYKLPEYDARAVARAFYRVHPDVFDALAVYENFPATHVAVTSHIPVRNDVRGIGLELEDHTAEYGSAGRLQSVLEMNRLAFLTDTNGSGILAHELGHTWLANVSFMDHGQKSRELVDAGGHWCDYFDTRIPGRTVHGFPAHSFMFGTMWTEPRPGEFLDGISTPGGYSPLDLYLMGLLSADSVPDMFYIASRPGQQPECRDRTMGRTTGTRRVVTIRDIIAAEGPRQPDLAHSPKAFRVGFVLLTLPGSSPTADEVAKLEGVRRSFERDFAVYTGGRGSLDTRLIASPP